MSALTDGIEQLDDETREQIAKEDQEALMRKLEARRNSILADISRMRAVVTEPLPGELAVSIMEPLSSALGGLAAALIGPRPE